MDQDELERVARSRSAARAIFRPSPDADDALRTRPFGAVADMPVRFYLYRDVIDELAYAAGFERKPSFAILTGSFAVDDDGPFLEVAGFDAFDHVASLDALYHAVRPALETTAAELARLPNTAESRHIVGLFCGVPDSAGRLDPEVARVHLSLFNTPYQLAVTVDPWSRKLGAYARPPRGPFFDAAFSVVAAADADADS